MPMELYPSSELYIDLQCLHRRALGGHDLILIIYVMRIDVFVACAIFRLYNRARSTSR